nr:RNA-directed DNA polymerase, eukaryota, reverse transcriptase zinc-binding domain protein [Tanacetum cinerariifolium]
MDFQKAFDSVCWDHLDEILGKFGFENKWRGWIRGCLNSSKALVLVNGSPTNEFSFHKGLRQGDPLSPFLFILVMESLQVSFQKLIDRGLFVPALVGKEDRLPISHLLYADDAMFIGLKVNVHKSSIYGVGVYNTDVQLMAASFGCVGADPDERKITWVSWKKVLAHKNQGGLGVNSLFALNLALMFKWIWRFFTAPSSLCISVIKSIHGNSGGLEILPSHCGPISTWSRIVKAINLLKEKGVDLMKYCNDRWSWTLHGLGVFSVKSAREEIDKHILVAAPSHTRWSKVLPIKLNIFWWRMFLDRLPTMSNRTQNTRNIDREEIDKHILVAAPLHTRWSKVLPIKLNIFWWRMFLDRLPTRSNLYNKGIDIPCVLCPNCEAVIESHNHLLFSCSMSMDLVRLFGRWWNIHVPNLGDPSSWDLWFKGLNLSSNQKQIIEAFFVSMWWHIWKFRNASLFTLKKPRKAMIFDDIVSHTFFWVNSRCSNFK